MLTRYYQKKKGRLSKEEKDKWHQHAYKRYRNLSEEEKEKKLQYGRE